MSSHDMTMDDVMKEVLVVCAFEHSAKYGSTYEEQLTKIKTDWELLFKSFRRFYVYTEFIISCEHYKLNWKNYDFDRHYLFLDEWKDEIQKKLFEQISIWFMDTHACYDKV